MGGRRGRCWSRYRSIGNGISIIIFAGIVAGLPAAVGGTLELASTGELSAFVVVILLVGALLVTGEFETARAVLTAFAEFMDMDPASPFYGRVPNRVRMEDLDYHATDGTPRFVLALQDNVRYSGDLSLVEDLYPKVRASVEGALANWTDDNGYLTHEENETWMDARRASDLAAYSPRDNRANDIQALWHGQLLAGVHFAKALEEEETARRWQATADRLAQNFERDFTSPDRDYLADRLEVVLERTGALRLCR